MKDKNASRIAEIDILRGIAVFLMIFDHAMFDLWGLLPGVFKGYPPTAGAWHEIYKTAREYWNWDVRVCVRIAVVFLFLALTGICCSFSRSNLKRGSKLLLVALALSIGTDILGAVMGERDMVIMFGVLHCIAVTLILVGVSMKYISSKWFYLAVGIVMIGAGLYFERDQVYMSLYSNEPLRVLAATITGEAASGSDNFSLFLYGGQIFVGVFLGKLLYRERRSLAGFEYKNNIVSFTGRHSLVVYIAHQVIIPIIMCAVLLLCGFRF